MNSKPNNQLFGQYSDKAKQFKTELTQLTERAYIDSNNQLYVFGNFEGKKETDLEYEYFIVEYAELEYMDNEVTIWIPDDTADTIYKELNGLKQVEQQFRLQPGQSWVDDFKEVNEL